MCIKDFFDFSVTFSKQSFAKPRKRKMSEAILQNLENADLTLQPQDKAVRSRGEGG